METIKLNKSRSIKACIIDAWHIFALDWRKYLKLTVIPATVAGMAGAFFIEMCLQLICKNFQPAYRLYQAGADASWMEMVMIPTWADLLLFLLSFILLFVFASYYKGKLLGIIHHFAENSAFADQRVVSLTSCERIMASKYAAMKLFFFVIFLALSALVVWSALQWKLGLLYLIPFLLIYFWTTGNVSRLQYVFGGEKFFSCIKQGLKKSMGYAFIVQILTFIPMLLLYAVFLLPAVIYMLSGMAAEDSRLVGDVTIIPAYLPLVFFLLNTIGIASLLLFNSVRTWSLTMKLNLFEESAERMENLETSDTEVK